MISGLEEDWHISVGEALSGGTHAFTAYADGEDGGKYALKIDMPEDLGGDFSREISTFQMADGHGFAKLYAYDPERKACLLERMGKPIDRPGFPVKKQLEIICSTLEKVWETPVAGHELPTGTDSVEWFRTFIGETWEKLGRPCSEEVVRQAFSCLRSREKAMDPSGFVLLHGDAHGGNTLETLSGGGYKLIDPDGILYEKAYDLGVLMREWRQEYQGDPVSKGKERCIYLSRLTGADARAIFEWGFLQCVSTGMVFWNINKSVGKELFDIAESWLSGTF